MNFYNLEIEMPIRYASYSFVNTVKIRILFKQQISRIIIVNE